MRSRRELLLAALVTIGLTQAPWPLRADILVEGDGAPGAGGSTNAWIGSSVAVLASSVDPGVDRVVGHHYTGAISVQTESASVGGDVPGPPITGGDLVFDLNWVYTAAATSSSSISVVVSQVAVATATIKPGVVNKTTVRFGGNVPTPGLSPGGFDMTHLTGVIVSINSSTTAEGQGLIGLDIKIDE